MPKFAANLTMMFNEVPFPVRFAAASKAGFKGVEFLFPYDYGAEEVAQWLHGNGLESVLINLPPGNWAAGERGTIVKVRIDYRPPAGFVGSVVAMLFGEEPSQQVQSDLRRFKQILETGEVVVSDATLSGTGLTDQSPAQPKAMSAGR